MHRDRNEWKNTQDRLNVTIQTLNKEKCDISNNYTKLEQEMKNSEETFKSEIKNLNATVRSGKKEIETLEEKLDACISKNAKLTEEIESLKTEFHNK